MYTYILSAVESLVWWSHELTGIHWIYFNIFQKTVDLGEPVVKWGPPDVLFSVSRRFRRGPKLRHRTQRRQRRLVRRGGRGRGKGGRGSLEMCRHAGDDVLGILGKYMENQWWPEGNIWKINGDIRETYGKSMGTLGKYMENQWGH